MNSRKKDQVLIEAAAFYQDHDYLSIRKVASIFGIEHHATLAKRISGKTTSRFNRRNGNLKLSHDQETALIDYLTKLHYIGVPLREKSVRNAANSILTIAYKHQDNPPQVGEK